MTLFNKRIVENKNKDPKVRSSHFRVNPKYKDSGPERKDGWNPDTGTRESMR